MKKCSKCKKEMPLDRFNKNARRKDGLQTFCKSCSRSANKKHYKNNTKKHKARTSIHKNNHKIKLHKFVFEYLLENPCNQCGEANPVLLEFDHLKDKDSCVSNAVKNLWSINRVKKEIDKCQVLCSNCHKMKTAKDQGWYTYKMMYPDR